MSLKDKAKNVLVSCLDAKPKETVLVVTDDSRLSIGQAVYEAASELGCESLLFRMKEGTVSGEEPPKAVAEAMKWADIVICPTAQSLTHTNARIGAVKNNARVATMPGITEAMFENGAMTADYASVEILTEKVAKLLDHASTARLEKDGYVLTMDLRERKGIRSPGVYRRPGESGNLPSGEAYIAPKENGSDGEMMIDGSMVGIGKLDSPLHVKIKNGKVQEITGEKSELLSLLLESDNNATLGELGIGTNEKAILSGIILEDEKVFGTVHIAFGTNTSFGGTNKAACHMDGIILKPTLYLDDILVIKEGTFVIS